MNAIASPTTPNTATTIPTGTCGSDKKITPLVVLRQYFGPRFVGEPVTAFREELIELSSAEKLELATLAADAMGIPIEGRDFAKLESEAMG